MPVSLLHLPEPFAGIFLSFFFLNMYLSWSVEWYNVNLLLTGFFLIFLSLLLLTIKKSSKES